MYHLWRKEWHICEALEDSIKCSDLHSEVRDTLLVEDFFYNNCERIVERVVKELRDCKNIVRFIAVRVRRLTWMLT
jgi:hypothetical protein